MIKPTCETCQFWEKTPNGPEVLGECRRYPPREIIWDTGQALGQWAKTFKLDRCGEHKAIINEG